MKVLFDHKGFVEKYGGVSKYFSEIIKYHLDEYDVAMKFSVNEYLKQVKPDCIDLFKQRNFRGMYRILSILNEPNTIKTLKKGNYDIVHLTHYDPYLFKYKKNEKFISTIHDLNFFSIPEYFNTRRAAELKRGQILCAKKSDHIITISENSKKDLIKFLSIPEERISVIYHGVSSSYSKDNAPRLLQDPYVLFVGYRGAKYKNFENAVRAFSIISKDYKNLKFVCTRDDFNEHEIKLFNELEISEKVIHYAASEKELINLYSYAEFFIYPSVYEGFGLPLLEAMACECPVLCSNTSCFPEIAGNAACYFNPEIIDSIVMAMNSILSDDCLKASLIMEGKKRLTLFSWEKSAQQHYEVYKKILGEQYE